VGTVAARLVCNRKHHKLAIIKSFQPGEDWGWCYVDEEMFEEL